MALILCIETSGTVCSVALCDENKECLGVEKEEASFKHAAVATVLIQKLLKSCQVETKQIDAIAISAGPGSYTGLRIGTSVAKGLCYALNKPLIAISSLELLANGFKQTHTVLDDDLICSAIDARRMEIYTAIYDLNLNSLFEPSPLIVTSHVFDTYLDKFRVFIIGSGAEKTAKEINHSNLLYKEGYYLSAEYMVGLAAEKWENKEFVDRAYFEPNYLKAFHTTAKIK